MAGDHLPLIDDFGELTSLFNKSPSIQAFLQEMVELVSRHLNTDVASIYLYDEDAQELQLKATRGLKIWAIDVLSLQLGEGLVGTALKELRPILDNSASQNPSFKAVEGIDEERYDCMLCVPIRRGLKRIGVLTVQREARLPFSAYDTLALSALTSQLAMLIEQASLLMLGTGSGKTQETVIELAPHYTGKSGAPGLGIGPARVFNKQANAWPPKLNIDDSPLGVMEFERALAATIDQLEVLQEKVEAKLADVASLIFTSHLLMLKDKGFTGEMVTSVKEGIHPFHAVSSVVQSYIDIFSHSDNPAMREKVQDLIDLGKRLLENLGVKPRDLHSVENAVIVARDLLPSDLLKISADGAQGIVLVSGGVTSHLAILARSLQIPLAIVDVPDLLNLEDDTSLLLNATSGDLWIDPPQTQLDQALTAKSNTPDILPDAVLADATTQDGKRIDVAVNINLTSDMDYAKAHKPDGVGLYRTEFPFLLRANFPTEEEQYLIFRKVTTGLGGKPVTVRTIDIGGDKILSYYDSQKEENPFLGLRSIRFALTHRDIFLDHLRAILRAGHGCDLGIMFPIIGSLEELHAAKAAIAEAIEQLANAGIAHHPAPRIGIMVEVPSVIQLLPEFAKEVDFFSLGTNDFVQYLLCVDRTNEKVADFYCPHHPSVIRAIKQIADTAQANNNELCVCGDMAHHVEYLPLLLGLGISQLSVDGQYLDEVRKAITALNQSDCSTLTDTILHLASINEIGKLLGIKTPYHLA